jgi:hypothetical protein
MVRLPSVTIYQHFILIINLFIVIIMTNIAEMLITWLETINKMDLACEEIFPEPHVKQETAYPSGTHEFTP